ncbi:hybrid sensor histidine kinase/response regulator [Massilia niastensis]|uniref:hybrid sensor histidine kinase/response regulator n=1 Tax=Massilia niastensis TaxID=544911 RepID=UPI0003826F03|nr:response regulator [Massilia niastensis]
MSEPGQAFRHRLLAIFADEARGHLRRIEAGLMAYEQAGDDAARAGALESVLKALHTLKGAARAVDLDQLERLCHAVEGLCAAAPGASALAAGELDRLHQAVALAGELAAGAGGRARNQAAALCLQLDQAAARLAREAPAPLASAAPARPSAPAAPDPVAPPQADTPVSAPLPDFVRVRAAQLDAIRTETEALLASELSLNHQIGELRALAAGMGGQDGGREPGAAAALRCEQLAQALATTCAGLAATRTRMMGAVLETALVPFSEALDELPALVRKLARERGREVQLAVEGAAVQVDRRVLGAIREALIHLVANAVDHGIEPVQARLAAGKGAAGTLRVAVHQPDARQVLLRVSDDGAGLDAAALAAAAARSGMSGAELDALGEQERLRLALRPGVSTRAEVGALSGRGMGLAVVADAIAAVGGELSLESGVGRGSLFELRLPVSLASLRALVVEAGGRRYAAPLAALGAVRAVRAGEVRTVENRATIVADGRVLPLVRLAVLFGAPAPEPGAASGVALLVQGAAQPYALLVDAILAEQDVLPRGLGPLLRRVRHFTGAVQLGDGALVPVLGLDDLGARARHGGAGPAPAMPTAPQAAGGRHVLVVEDSITSRLLLKHILEGAGCRVDTAADGLEALSRLRRERFDAVVSDIEMPRLDGLALTAAIRADPDTAQLPVILVTSLHTSAERERGLLAGADAYLTKGAFDQDQLLATLRRLT